MQFLKKGLFEKDFMQTKVTTHSMSFKEKCFGYALGPGFVMVYTLMVTSLREMFYLQVIPLDQIFGVGTYMTLQTVSALIGLPMGWIMSWINERTVSKSGRFRPYVLIGTILMCLSGVGMFWTPFANESKATLVWLYIANIIYLDVATVLYNCSAGVIAVSTRNLKDRAFVTTLRSSLGNMIPGVFGAIIVMGWLYFVYLANDKTGDNWRLFIVVTAVIGIVAAFIEYFYTRERITEENQEVAGEGKSQGPQVPFIQQIKNMLTNKYYILQILAGFGFALGSTLQGANARTYFTQWILGANEYNGLATIYLMIAMQPMAIGTVIIPMLARRHGSRKIMIVSSIVVLAGLGVCMINPWSFAIACAGGLIFSFGCVAMSNMNGVIGHQAADMVEYKAGYRIEGTLAASIIGGISAALLSPFSAIYETGLSYFGYDAFATAQNASVNNWIIFAYYGGYAIQAVSLILIMIFFDAEKKLPAIQAELKERRKAATITRGEEWVDPDEQERLAWEQSIKEAEENEIRDLKERCAKKGLDFDKEYAKYQKKAEKKKAKAQKKYANTH